jgi:hypothetical protein
LKSYIISINTHIAINHAKAAHKAPFNELSQRVGLIFSSCINTKGAGKAQSFNASANSLALSAVNEPSI